MFFGAVLVGLTALLGIYVYVSFEQALMTRARRKQAQRDSDVMVVQGKDGTYIRDLKKGVHWMSMHLSPKVLNVSGNFDPDDVSFQELMTWYQFQQRGRKLSAPAGQAALPGGGEVPALPIPWPERIDLTESLPGQPSWRNLYLGVSFRENGQQYAIQTNIKNLVNVAVGGSTGFGKSVFLRTIGYQLLVSNDPVELVMIDLANSALTPFAQSNRLLYPLATDEEGAQAVLYGMIKIMKDREAMLAAAGADDMLHYNKLAIGIDEPMLPLVAMVDEANDLMEHEVLSDLSQKLARRMRKCGMWFVCAAQEWNLRSMEARVRRNFSSRVQFWANDLDQARMLVGNKGAHLLLDNSRPVEGRAVMRLTNGPIVKVQTPYISREGIASVITRGDPRYQMPIVMPESRVNEDDEFVRLVNEEGLSRREAAMKAYNREYAGSTVNRGRRALGEI